MAAYPKSDNTHNDRQLETGQGDRMTRGKFLTVRWNNRLSVVGGLIFLAYALVVATTSALPDNQAFLGLAAIGVLY
jgi:hypothetical protein